jgi:transposase
MALERPDGTVQNWKLTRGQYYAESGIVKARGQSETWQRPVRKLLDRLSEVSSKGMAVKAHTQYLEVLLETYDDLWKEYLKPRWANQRLRLYGGKKRVFATFLNKVEREATTEGHKRVVVAYGAAKFAPGGRGELSVPTSRAFKECTQRFRVVLVDEFRTTMVYAGDDSVLKQVWSKDKGAVVRGLMWCDSTNNSKFVNRDLNAALNIRRCLVLPTRPAILCRVNGQAALVREVGKYIKR